MEINPDNLRKMILAQERCAVRGEYYSALMPKIENAMLYLDRGEPNVKRVLEILADMKVFVSEQHKKE
jgi:hypothetical protein